MKQNISLEKIYRYLRVAIYTVPVLVLAFMIYLILFPVEKYSFVANDPEQSKLRLNPDADGRSVSFGVFPLMDHKLISLTLKTTPQTAQRCLGGETTINLEKTFRAFLYPTGDAIVNEDQLKDILFARNGTKYPSGTLLHLLPTDEIFLVSEGKKILFPGPEIFRAFGYSFENLVGVEKSTVDLFPEAENRVYLWTMPHPDGTIFQAFPSHKLYILSGSEKHEIADPAILQNVWPANYSIPVADRETNPSQACQVNPKEIQAGKISCEFEKDKFGSPLGGYYNFSLSPPQACSFQNLDIKNIKINLIPGKSFATVKNSLRNIFASILNRYVYPSP